MRFFGTVAILSVATVAICSGAARADLNGDGILDAFVVTDENGVYACLGDGTGGFDCGSGFGPSQDTDVALGDLDGDGDLDAVVAAGLISVCLGDGTGVFEFDFVCDFYEESGSGGVALGFVDSDRNLDAVLGAGALLCLGDGTGGFRPCSGTGADIFSSTARVALGDVDNDGNLDAVFSNDSLGPNRVCLGDGQGGFACSDVSEDAGNFSDVALGFLDEDNNLDVVFAGQRNRVCLGDGQGGFACRDVGEDFEASAVALGDLDGDRDLDAVFAIRGEFGEPIGWICLGNGRGGFRPCGEIIASSSDTVDVALGYIDRDRNLDALFANPNETSSSGTASFVCFGDGEGGFLSCSEFFGSGFLNGAMHTATALAAGDLDGDEVADDQDNCIQSDLSDTVVVAGDDTGVANPLTDTKVPTLFRDTLGCTVADLIQETAALAVSRAQFLRNVQLLLRAVIREGILTYTEAQTLRIAVAQAPFPYQVKPGLER